jgi:hypothetical protein
MGTIISSGGNISIFDGVGGINYPNISTLSISGSAIITNPTAGTIAISITGGAPVLTTGSIPFSNGTALIQDNANFFWDDTNNRLGIGTNAPTDRITVLGGGIYAKSAVGGNILQLVNSSNVTALTVDNSNARLLARSINLTTPTYGFLTASTYGLGQTGTQVSLIANSIAVLAASSSLITVANGVNFAFNTGTGTKLGTATTQKLSFWNATPIAQPTTTVTAATYVGLGGGNIQQNDTFDGYTIAKIVKALRNIGLLA